MNPWHTWGRKSLSLVMALAMSAGLTSLPALAADQETDSADPPSQAADTQTQEPETPEPQPSVSVGYTYTGGGSAQITGEDSATVENSSQVTDETPLTPDPTLPNTSNTDNDLWKTDATRTAEDPSIPLVSDLPWGTESELLGDREILPNFTGQTVATTQDGQSAFTYGCTAGAPVGRELSASEVALEDYYSPDVIDQVRAIALKGYWGTTQGTGSLETFKEMLQANNVLTEDQLAQVTDGVALTATQAALWHFGTDGDQLANPLDGSESYDETTTAKLGLVQAIYDYLIADSDTGSGLAPVAADLSNTFLTPESFVNSIQLLVKEKVAADTYNTDVALTMAQIAQDSSTVLQVTVGDTVYALAKEGSTSQNVTYEDGAYTIHDVVLQDGQTVDITLSGSQVIQGVKLYQESDSFAVGGGDVDLDSSVRVPNPDLEVAIEAPDAKLKSPARGRTISEVTVDQDLLSRLKLEVDLNNPNTPDVDVNGPKVDVDVPEISPYTFLGVSTGSQWVNMTVSVTFHVEDNSGTPQEVTQDVPVPVVITPTPQTPTPEDTQTPDEPETPEETPDQPETPAETVQEQPTQEPTPAVPVVPTEDSSDLDENGTPTGWADRDANLDENGVPTGSASPDSVTQLAYAGSTASSSDAVQAVPATGDDLGLWVAIAAVTMGGMAAMEIYGRKVNQ